MPSTRKRAGELPITGHPSAISQTGGEIRVADACERCPIKMRQIKLATLLLVDSGILYL